MRIQFSLFSFVTSDSKAITLGAGTVWSKQRANVYKEANDMHKYRGAAVKNT